MTRRSPGRHACSAATIAVACAFGWVEATAEPMATTLAGVRLPAASVPDAAAAGWVLVDFDQGETLSAWDQRLVAEQPGTLLCGTSSEFIFFAVLDGSFEARLPRGSRALKAGRLLLLRHLAAGEPRVQHFAAAELAGLLREQGKAVVAADMEPLVARQKTRRFWGLLRPTVLDVARPTADASEQLRREYLNSPTVLGVKRASSDGASLTRGVAETFLSAARSGDAEAVAELLSPAPFRESAKAGRFQEDRLRIAERLLDQPWVQAGGPLQDADGDAAETGAFRFDAGGRPWRMQLEVFDGGVYVKSVEPAASGPGKRVVMNARTPCLAAALLAACLGTTAHAAEATKSFGPDQIRAWLDESEGEERITPEEAARTLRATPATELFEDPTTLDGIAALRADEDPPAGFDVNATRRVRRHAPHVPRGHGRRSRRGARARHRSPGRRHQPERLHTLGVGHARAQRRHGRRPARPRRRPPRHRG